MVVSINIDLSPIILDYLCLNFIYTILIARHIYLYPIRIWSSIDGNIMSVSHCTHALDSADIGYGYYARDAIIPLSIEARRRCALPPRLVSTDTRTTDIHIRIRRVIKLSEGVMDLYRIMQLPWPVGMCKTGTIYD